MALRVVALCNTSEVDSITKPIAIKPATADVRTASESALWYHEEIGSCWDGGRAPFVLKSDPQIMPAKTLVRALAHHSYRRNSRLMLLVGSFADEGDLLQWCVSAHCQVEESPLIVGDKKIFPAHTEYMSDPTWETVPPFSRGKCYVLLGALPQAGYQHFEPGHMLNGVLPGFKELTMPHILDTSIVAGENPKLAEPIRKLPQNLNMPENIMEARTIDERFNMQYSLYGSRKGKIETQSFVGRVWSPYFEMDPIFVDGETWGQSKPVLHPGFASVADSVMDKNALGALASISRIFGEVKTTSLTTEARIAMRELPYMQVNHIRYLWRLAVMHAAAEVAMASRTTLNFHGDRHGMVRERTISGMATLNEVLSYGHARAGNVVYIETPGMGQLSADLLKPLRIAALDEPVFEMSSGTNAAILSLWPRIPGLMVAVLQEQTLNPLEVPELTPGVIWDAAMMYCKQHNIVREWEEVVESVNMFLVRPEKAKALLGQTKVVIALPTAKMQACALGPMLSSVRIWSDRGDEPDKPSYSQMAFSGSMRFMLWESILSTVLLTGGLREAMNTHAHPKIERYLKRQLACSGSSMPLAHGVEHIAEKLGFPGLLGRSLAGVGLARKTDLLGDIYKAVGITVQWDELLPFVNAVPEGSNIFGVLYPVKLQTTQILRTWAGVKTVIGRQGIQDAFYSLNMYGAIEYGTQHVNMLEGSSSVVPYTVPVNYRGTMADNMFMPLSLINAKSERHVFKINDVETLLRASDGAMKRGEWQWHIEWERDIPYNSLVDALDTIPTPSSVKEEISVEDAPAASPAVTLGPTPTTGAKHEIQPEVQQSHQPPKQKQAAAKDSAAMLAAEMKRNALMEIEQIQALTSQLPTWVSHVSNAYKQVSGNIAGNDNIETQIRAAANALANYNIFNNLTRATFAQRPQVAKAMSRVANLAMDMALAHGGVQYKPFLNMSKTFDQVAGVMEVCPAIRVDEYLELAGKDQAPFTDKELQAGILQGISALSGATELAQPEKFVEAAKKLEEAIKPPPAASTSWADMTEEEEMELAILQSIKDNFPEEAAAAMVETGQPSGSTTEANFGKQPEQSHTSTPSPAPPTTQPQTVEATFIDPAVETPPPN
jgi:hypothetical protein